MLHSTKRVPTVTDGVLLGKNWESSIASVSVGQAQKILILVTPPRSPSLLLLLPPSCPITGQVRLLVKSANLDKAYFRGPGMVRLLVSPRCVDSNEFQI